MEASHKTHRPHLKVGKDEEEEEEDVEFTQGKLRIARDTTVNDYLCRNGVLL